MIHTLSTIAGLKLLWIMHTTGGRLETPAPYETETSTIEDLTDKARRSGASRDRRHPPRDEVIVGEANLSARCIVARRH